MVIDGRTIPAASLQHRRIIIIDDKYIVVDADRTLRRGTIKIDATRTPKHIDAIPAEGHHAGKTDRGIYELGTDLLQICWAPPGQPRPTDFACEPGSKKWMATDQRETAEMVAEQSRVVAVTGESPGFPGIHTTRVYHRDFPELSGEAPTPYEAGLVLLRHLVSDTGTIADGLHRERLDKVIAEVRAFLDRVA